MAGEVRIGGSTASVKLQGNDSITSDQTFTFPEEGGELVTAPSNGVVTGYQQGVMTLQYRTDDGTLSYNNHADCTNGSTFIRVGNQVTVYAFIASQGAINPRPASRVYFDLPYGTSGGRRKSFFYGSMSGFLAAFTSDNPQPAVAISNSDPRAYFYIAEAGGGSQPVPLEGPGLFRSGGSGRINDARVIVTYPTNDTTWVPNPIVNPTVDPAAVLAIQEQQAVDYAAFIAANPGSEDLY